MKSIMVMNDAFYDVLHPFLLCVLECVLQF